MTLLSKIRVTAIAAMLPACSAGYLVSQPGGPRGYIRLEIEPASATVEIDEHYNGIANGWADSVIPVTPGVRRLALSADGYITQRFDLEVAPYEEVTLVLNLEPILDIPDDPTPGRADPFRPAQRPRR